MEEIITRSPGLTNLMAECVSDVTTKQPTNNHFTTFARLQFLLNCSLDRCSRFDRANYSIDLDKNKTRGRYSVGNGSTIRLDNDAHLQCDNNKKIYIYFYIARNIPRIKI